MVRNYICVLRSGGDFGWEYVKALKVGLSRTSHAPHQLFCLTDAVTHEGEIDGVHTIPLLKNWPGRWSKIELFRPDLERYRPFFFLDLDTAIISDLDQLLSPMTAMRQWMMLRDLYRPERPASGLMYLPQFMDWGNIWDDFCSRAEAIIRHDHGQADDGEYIYKQIFPGAFFQDAFPGRISSFKPKDATGAPQWLKEVPPGVVVVCFHGQPRPPEAAKSVEWVAKYWADAFRPCVSSSYPRRHEGPLLIVGSGPTWKEDYKVASAARPNAKVMTIGHAAGLVQADFLVTDHYETHPSMTKLQLKFHTEFTNHCTRGSPWRSWAKWVDYWWDWERSTATSLQTAVRIGLEMGFTELILCGCPMDAAPMVHPAQRKKDGAQWPPPNKVRKLNSPDVLEDFRSHFLLYAPAWRDRNVHSMSGWTREQLGGPTL